MGRVVRVVVSALSLVAGVAATAAFGGCGPSTPPKETTVRGRLTFQGEPVAGGTVVFVPDPDRGGAGKPVRADTAADGTFTLRPADGPVRAGWYRVALAAPAAAPTDPPFPPELRRPDRSGVAREVTAGKDHVFEFAVEATGAADPAVRP